MRENKKKNRKKLGRNRKKNNILFERPKKWRKKIEKKTNTDQRENSKALVFALLVFALFLFEMFILPAHPGGKNLTH